MLLFAGRVSWNRSCQFRGPTIVSFYTRLDKLDAILVSRLVHTLLAAPGMDDDVLLHGPWVHVECLHYSSWMEPGVFCFDSMLLLAALVMDVDVVYKVCLPCSPVSRTVHL